MRRDVPSRAKRQSSVFLTRESPVFNPRRIDGLYYINLKCNPEVTESQIPIASFTSDNVLALSVGVSNPNAGFTPKDLRKSKSRVISSAPLEDAEESREQMGTSQNTINSSFVTPKRCIRLQTATACKFNTESADNKNFYAPLAFADDEDNDNSFANLSFVDEIDLLDSDAGSTPKALRKSKTRVSFSVPLGDTEESREQSGNTQNIINQDVHKANLLSSPARPTFEWHLAVNHSERGEMKQMPNKVKGIKYTDKDFDFDCPACLIAKSKLQHY